MPDLMQNYRDYLDVTKARLAASGFNDHMAAVYGIMREIAGLSTTEEDYRRLSDERNLNLETYRASALDTYSARFRQAKDDGILPDRDLYSALLERLRAATDMSSISADITQTMENIGTETRKRSQREWNMRAILDNLIDYAYQSPLLDAGKFVEHIRDHSQRVRENEGDPDRLLRDPDWRSDYRLPDALWMIIEHAWEEIKSGQARSKEPAKDEYEEEFRREVKELSGLRPKMREVYEAHDAEKERKRSTWLARATPDGYEYEPVWMQGGK